MPNAQPNYIYTAPNGDVSASFAGGLDIHSNTFSPTNPGARRQIRWRKSLPSGPVVAGIDASYNFSADGWEQLSLFTGPGTGYTGMANILLLHRAGSQPAQVLVQMNGGPNEPVALSIANDLGQSSFMRALDTRRVYGQYNGILGPVSVTIDPMVLDAASTVPMRISYTPEVDAWWFVQSHIGYVQAFTAAYNYCYLFIHLNPPDMDGVAYAQSLIMQHSQVNLYEAHHPTALFRLARATAYTVSTGIAPQSPTGSFGYYAGRDYLNMSAVAWQQ